MFYFINYKSIQRSGIYQLQPKIDFIQSSKSVLHLLMKYKQA